MASLSGLSINMRCPWGNAATMQCRLLAAQIGWKAPLRAVLPRIRCKRCGFRAIGLAFIDSPQWDTMQYGFRATKMRLEARFGSCYRPDNITKTGSFCRGFRP